MTDLDELESKARAATPGPWRISDSHGLCIVNCDESAPTALIADMSSNSDEGRWDGRREDAVFIVAARDVVLALIARVRAAEARLVDLERSYSNHNDLRRLEHEQLDAAGLRPDLTVQDGIRLLANQRNAAQARIAELEAALHESVQWNLDFVGSFLDGTSDETMAHEKLDRLRRLITPRP